MLEKLSVARVIVHKKQNKEITSLGITLWTSIKFLVAPLSARAIKKWLTGIRMFRWLDQEQWLIQWNIYYYLFHYLFPYGFLEFT